MVSLILYVYRISIHATILVHFDGPATTDYAVTPASPDNSFLGFCGLCERLEKEPSYNAKTKLIYTYLKYGNSGGQQLQHFCYVDSVSVTSLVYCTYRKFGMLCFMLVFVCRLAFALLT